MQLSWDRTGAKLLNIPHYQTITILMEVPTDNFLLLLLYYGCKTNQRSTLSEYSIHLLVHGYQGPEIAQQLMHKTLLEDFLNMSLISDHFTDETLIKYGGGEDYE